MPDLSTECIAIPQLLATTATTTTTTTMTHGTAGPQQCTRTDQDSLASEAIEHWTPVASDMHKQRSFGSNIQTKVDDACILSTSGVAMLQDLLTTATDAQRQLCHTGNCVPSQAAEEQTPREGQNFGEHGNTFTPMTGGSGVGSAEVLDTLRLPRLVATVRHALEEWRKWESDGFPLD